MFQSYAFRRSLPVLAACLVWTMTGRVPGRCAASTAAAEAVSTSPHRAAVRSEVLPDAGTVAGGDAARAVFDAPSRPAAGAGGARFLREGWPVSLNTPGSGFPYTPTLADVDADGADEIFLTGGHTFALRGDGSFMPGWPTTEMLNMGYGTNGQKPGPSVADLEGDGDTEILWTERDWWAGSSYMWCMNGKNADGANVGALPQHAPDQSSNALDTPFVLGDVDGDGDLEAWSAHTLGNTFVHYRISAFDHLGERLFTVDLDPAENVLSLYYGDVDGDGTREMFAVSWLEPDLWLHVFTATGGSQPGYPRLLDTLTSGYLPVGPPVPADLDADGDLEILFGHWGGGASYARASHHDGTPVVGFPHQLATSSQLFYVGLGDITGDGVPEIIAFDNHLGGAYRAIAIALDSGLAVPGWPFSVPDWPKGFPTVVDIDDDGLQEVLMVTDGGELYAVASDGRVVPGYPEQMASASISGVAAGDIDADGLYELVTATWDGWVYAWETAGEVLPGRADWPLRGVNARNTGVFGDTGTTTAVVSAGSAMRRPVVAVCANPVSASATFRCEGVTGGAVLQIYDARGRFVDRIPTGGAPRVTWRAGGGRPSGVYFARLADGGVVQQVRFVLAR
ncbi:MAG: VCBS repeat-containing protein [Candidatus Eiseniibacteriota bacterium]